MLLRQGPLGVLELSLGLLQAGHQSSFLTFHLQGAATGLAKSISGMIPETLLQAHTIYYSALDSKIGIYYYTAKKQKSKLHAAVSSSITDFNLNPLKGVFCKGWVQITGSLH